MFTLRCTARLLKRIGRHVEADPPPPTTRLGDWAANLVHLGRSQLVLAVNEPTVLTVVVPAAPIGELMTRLRAGVGDVLRVLHVPDGDVERELHEMKDVVIAKTRDRRATGVLVDFAKALPFYLDDGDTLLDAALRLSRTPCGPLHKSDIFPDRAACSRFGMASDPEG